MNQQTTATSGANGHSSAQDIFVLTDEQILEIDPEPQDVQVRGSEPSGPEGKSSVGSGAPQAGAAAAETSTPAGGATTATKTAATTLDSGAQAAAPAPFSAPEDVRALAELYPGGLTQAKTAAERARTLDEIDAAYFGAAGNSPEQISAARGQLAERMLHENPAAFREMVFAGLRALETASAAPQPLVAQATVAQAFRPEGSSSVADGGNVDDKTLTPSGVSYSAYTAFEKAANADLEKSVGSAIERALHQALPNLKTSDPGATGAARHVVPLHDRLSGAIRQDVERALQSDRQLSEQVSQILTARRFDNETRAQVVRLINDRAQQLVPAAAKRALNDWTQTTLAAHHARTRSANANSSRPDVLPAAGQGSTFAASSPHASPSVRGPQDRNAAAQASSSRAATAGTPRSGRLDYRKLSDEQILDL